jgi:cyclophilin family peptidyl-prolyl cis-trans isomerase
MARYVAVAIGLVVMATPASSKPQRPKATLTTSLGAMTIELYSDEAPKTVANFIKLANQGFYNGIIFHRVIPQFMIQTGDPSGTGSGGPGYTFDDEISPNLRHDAPGIVSMANRGLNTNGSQFFITLAATPWLDDKHAIFGRVIEGQRVVEDIAAVERDGRDKPLKDVVLKQVTIQE